MLAMVATELGPLRVRVIAEPQTC